MPLIVRGPGLASRRVVDVPFVNVDWLPTLLELSGTDVPREIDGISETALLRTGRGSRPSRTLYWHLPHYTNQGSRPAGAVRDGDWKLVEHYDDDQVQLFNLASDIAETRNLASAEPARTAALREKLRAWRKAVDAQENRPNPAVNANLYNELYVTFDPTRFDPLHADDAQWQKVGEWRKRMNAAVATPAQ